MEYIDGLFTLVRDHWMLVFVMAMLAAFLESFVPALPLMGIVIANSMMLGLGMGLLASTIGSCLGTTLLFLIATRFSHITIFEKIRNDKIDKVIHWIKEQGFPTLFIAYSCPFIPGCLVTIASGISRKDLYSFVPAMASGKFVMFMVASYIGDDISGFIQSPIKIVFVAILVFIS
ncbi:MAG: TVP38/TMEM64 family protein, partial [Paraclostridium sp.]